MHLIAAFVLFATVQARFGQEQVPIAAIASLTEGPPGVAQTLAGNSVQFLLAAANPCGKLQQADLIVSQLGTSADVIAAARGLVAAEQNFNPFVVDVPSICSDPALPKTKALRGIVPLVDPAVVGSALENQNSDVSRGTPFADASGLSVAQLMVAHGFSNFTTKDVAGNTGRVTPSAGACAAPRTLTVDTSSCTVTTTSTATVTVTAVATATSAHKSTIAGLDFGRCVPTMKFEGGLGGRPSTEFTFQAIDPLVSKGQEEALDPNIITNRICDQLTNVCAANAAARSACQAAKTQIEALGTRDRATADAWNT